MAVNFDPDDLLKVEVTLEASLVAELGAVRITGGLERVGHGMDTYIYGFSLASDGLPPAWGRR